MSAPGFIAPTVEEFRLASVAVSEQRYQTVLSVPDMHCGGCIKNIENALGALNVVTSARVNLTEKRVNIEWEKAGNSFVTTALASSNLRNSELGDRDVALDDGFGRNVDIGIACQLG